MASVIADAFHRQGPFRVGGEIPLCLRATGTPFGVDDLRAANGCSAALMRVDFINTGLGRNSRFCQRDSLLAKPASPSAPPPFQFLGVRRFRRLGLGPRSRLRRSFDRPDLKAGGSASMGPTHSACRLLQLKTRRTSTIRERWSPQRNEGRNPLHVLCSVGDRLLAKVDHGPRATNSGAAPSAPLSSREGLGDTFRTSPSTSTTPCDAGYRWPWFGGSEDRVKDPRSLDGCADSPPQRLPSTRRHRSVLREVGTPHASAEPVRDPLSHAPPRRGTSS